MSPDESKGFLSKETSQSKQKYDCSDKTAYTKHMNGNSMFKVMPKEKFI